MSVDLRTERLNRGLSLQEAAETIGVEASVLSRAERGDTTPTPGNAFKIATFYGRKVTEVWPLDDERVPA
jgi:transcriptional regulator with XRE-family HTH domain